MPWINSQVLDYLFSDAFFMEDFLIMSRRIGVLPVREERHTEVLEVVPCAIGELLG